MLQFLKWLGIGMIVSTLLVVAYVAVTINRASKASPQIGAVSFSAQWALMWISIGAVAFALIATAVRSYQR